VCKAAGIRWDNHESLEDAPSTMIKFDAPGTKCTPYTCTHTQTYTGGTHTKTYTGGTLARLQATD